MNDRSFAAATEALRAAQFRRLLLRLDADRDRAGEKYEDLRRKLIRYFEWNPRFPVEALADETLDRVARKLATEEIHDLPAFVWAVAKNVRQEEQKRSSRIVHISDLPRDSLPQKPGLEAMIHDKINQEHRTRCFRCCLQRFPQSDRELFLKYYSLGSGAAVSRQRLAESLGMTITALRVRINRIRDKLENCVRRCDHHETH